MYDTTNHDLTFQAASSTGLTVSVPKASGCKNQLQLLGQHTTELCAPDMHTFLCFKIPFMGFNYGSQCTLTGHHDIPQLISQSAHIQIHLKSPPQPGKVSSWTKPAYIPFKSHESNIAPSQFLIQRNSHKSCRHSWSFCI